jgi:hypothetical protein
LLALQVGPAVVNGANAVNEAAPRQSTRGWAELCPWPNVQKSSGHPVVYVGNGSHASYFTPGSHSLPGFTEDTANGDGEVRIPSVDVLTDTSPTWLAWPGLWGGTNTGGEIGANSPTGPAQKGLRWTNPVSWESSQGACTAPIAPSSPQAMDAPRTTASGRRYGQPPLPVATAKLSGRTVSISYRFNFFPSDKQHRPWLLLTSVVSADKRYTPLTARTPVSARVGHVVQSVGLGRAPYKILLSVLAPTGARTKTIEVSLK